MPPCECDDKISSTASAEFSDTKVHNVVTRSSAVKTARRGASTAYEKTPDPLEDPGVFVEKSRVRAEGLEPSTQGLKVLCSTD